MSIKTMKSYGLFLLSIFIMGSGISLVTLAYLGTTPITAPPYVLSLSIPISFGVLTMFANIIFVLIEIIVLRKDFPKEQYLQLIVGPLLGLSIDFWSLIITHIPTSFYLIQLLMVVVGCIIIAYSTTLQLKANVVNNPAEGLVKAFVIKTSKSFGTIKLYFDISLVIIAIVISLVSFGSITGVREGTIISALIIGPIIKVLQTMNVKEKRYIA
ncbi:MULTISPECIES: YczE/YyaS/YitT family protein [Mammaliicoccus]|uniref:YczE/YyaS/YitT family protein n=1 Tax=Mammaliicoccus TaxID=2803850 RepID=UPI000CD173B9|nr:MULTISPECIES: DUF6198 family protein [Mammaliicoccus]HBV03899.1 hypothetical protein [Staphylococcus sp.]MBW0766662.1 YitT family protein [Mammaliicoccus lentus]MDQ7141716.1 DUF6198 family protein [Mammaliicoccus lentus]POA05544.1 hypothetical protein CD135_06195 [Mammaliicoccus lentus]SUM52824.1 Uncharacterized BCR, YitT family COG1284 [Mammaliicoccus lentus]